MTDAESAYLQMRLVYDQFAKDHFNSPPPLQGKGSVKAIHYIQSFSPDDNVTPELVHKIAKKANETNTLNAEDYEFLRKEVESLFRTVNISLSTLLSRKV